MWAAAWMGKHLRRGAWVVLLLPLLQGLLFWQEMDLRGDWTAIEWAEQVLRQAPSNAILLTTQDAHTFTLWYVHDVLNERPDVVVLDRDLWAQSSYRKMVGGTLGLESEFAPEEAARRAGRPVVVMNNEQ